MIKIGLEVHVQLDTKSKIFCGCSTKNVEEPNTNCCPTCIGMPGSKPVFNLEVLKQALKVALALNCKITNNTFFSRKTYFYPDMNKNFQITQYELPLAIEGSLNNIRIRRVHMEEDPGKLVHMNESCLVDYNRAGIPLIEIVTEPDFKDAEEARVFLNRLITTLEYLGVYTRISEASLRADVNISMDGGERVEVKNVNGIKDVERVLNYEIIRQKQEKAVRETRAWDSEKGITFSLRKKETEEDYGYITEGDLTQIEIDKKLIEEVRKNIPELSHERVERYIKKYNIARDDAEAIAAEFLLSELYDKVAVNVDPVLAAKWMRRELMRVVHYNKLNLHDLEMDENHLIQLLKLIESGKITAQVGQRLIEKLIEKPFDVEEYVKKEGLGSLSEAGELEKYCKEVIKENPKPTEDYKKGEEKALHFLVGKVMRLTKSKATPKEVNEILRRLIK